MEEETMENKNPKHVQISEGLIAQHDILAELIGQRPFHYVDYPMHGNVGDLLIMLGTLAFFKKAGLTPRLMSPYFSFKKEWIADDDVIVFHGGGNFGDLYPVCQELRERIASAKPGNRIIVMPQSLHFSTPEKAAASAVFFRSHPDLHLCVRDAVSLEVARQFTDKVYLLPDMAHQLYPLASAAPAPPRGTLLIRRVDDEKSSDGAGVNYGERTLTDWPQFVGEREKVISLFRKVSNRLGKLGLGWLANRLISPLWMRYSHALMVDATRLFGAHERVATDRLHGHILSFVMSIPSTVLDNSYGKNSRYASAWTAGSELTTLPAPAGVPETARRAVAP